MNFLICESILTSSNSILKNAYPINAIEYYVSGSSYQYIEGKAQLTKPEYVFDQINKSYDWCSNCGKTLDEHPFIVLSIKNSMMNIEGYFLKSGCCDGSSCCCYESGSYCCRCCLYSWSLQISNDNSSWETIHRIEKDSSMEFCTERTYKFSKSYRTKYVRLIQDESCPGDPPCIALNKIELIGDFDNGNPQFDVDDEDVSIIGHISKSHLNNI